MSPDHDLRAWVAALFADPETATDDEQPPPDRARNNVSPREGNNPQGDDPDAEALEFVRQRFDVTD